MFWKLPNGKAWVLLDSGTVEAIEDYHHFHQFSDTKSALVLMMIDDGLYAHEKGLLKLEIPTQPIPWIKDDVEGQEGSFIHN
jgi:hypothetical protein